LKADQTQRIERNQIIKEKNHHVEERAGKEGGREDKKGLKGSGTKTCELGKACLKLGAGGQGKKNQNDVGTRGKRGTTSAGYSGGRS